MKKKNFKFNDQVRIVNTGCYVDQFRGRIVGKASENVIDTYIVDLYGIFTGESGEQYSAIVLTESCLELVTS